MPNLRSEIKDTLPIPTELYDSKATHIRFEQGSGVEGKISDSRLRLLNIKGMKFGC